MIKYWFMKVLYYVLWTMCLLQLCLFLFMPFGGPILIWTILKTGLYQEKNFTYFTHSVLSAELIPWLNRAVALANFGSIVCCLSTILMYRNNKSKRYNAGIILGIIPLVILFIGKLMRMFSPYSNVW